MDLSKKRISTFLISVFFLATFSLQAQAWEISIEHLAENNSLEVIVYGPDNIEEDFSIQFNESILKQNLKSNLSLISEKKEQLRSLESPFKINFKETHFSYTISLDSLVNVPTSAFITQREMEIWNLKEILFSVNDTENPEIEIHFINGNFSAVQTKYLKEWKANPSIINPQKTFVEVNNIRFFSTLKGEELQKLISQTLKDFNYLKEEGTKEVYLIFDSKGLQSGGACYDDVAIIYFDAQTSQKKGLEFIQAIILHELFHFVLPYEIVAPESDQSMMNWVSEAAPEYFTYRYLLKNKMISERVFLDVMEGKLRQSIPYNPISLVDLSKGIYTNPDYYQAFYSKGVIALWMMEMKMKEANNYTYTFQELLERSDPDYKEVFSKETKETIEEFSVDLIYNSVNFSLNKLLVNFGLLYEKKIILPLEKNQKVATILLENINYNKMASAEQKEHWQRFITD